MVEPHESVFILSRRGSPQEKTAFRFDIRNVLLTTCLPSYTRNTTLPTFLKYAELYLYDVCITIEDPKAENIPKFKLTFSLKPQLSPQIERLYKICS